MPKNDRLSGLSAAVFETRHSETLCGLVRLSGGEPVAAPCLKEVSLVENPDVFAFADKLFQGRIDVLVLLTGVGTRTLLSVLETRYPKETILAAFKKIAIVPRGPKPVRVLNEWGVPFAFTAPEPNTWQDLLAAWDTHPEVPLRGRTVAVQEYGVSNPRFLEGLQVRGAHVMRVPVYRWTLPDDTAPLEAAIRRIADGRMDIALFTTAVQIDHVLEVAGRLGLAERFKTALSRMVVASVGPDCSENLLTHGIHPDLEPESPKMGPLVELTADRAKAVLSQKRETDCAAEVISTVLSITSDESGPLRQSAFMKACRREKTPYTPVWLMRQAGRYMKEYRDVRDKVSFLELCKTPDMAAEVTVTAQERLGVDAAIIFSDILLIVEPFGLGLDYVKSGGPKITRPVRSLADVEALTVFDAAEELKFVLEAIRRTRRSLKADIPLIGFAGAPFTVASYMIEGGSTRDFEKTRSFMHEEPLGWQRLLEKIADATVRYLQAQIGAGAQAVQLFDSWAGKLTPEEYERYAMPYSASIFKRLGPSIMTLHFGTGTSAFLEKLARAGGHVIGVDHTIALDVAWAKIGHDRAIQGNLDPRLLCADLETVRREVRRILGEAGGRPGHIFNLGHGILPETPVEHAVELIRMVHEFSRSGP